MAAEPPSSSEHVTTWKFGYSIYHAESRAQWRAWLEANHDAAPGVWLCSWRAPTEKPVCPYPDAIDSTVNVLDEHRTLQLMTPRQPKSPWTRLNRRRAADLDAAGLMTEAGRRAIEVARRNGWWTISDPVEDLVEPDHLAAALDADPVARAHWDAFPPSARKAMLWWVISAAKDETRARRVEAIVEKAGHGERAQG